MTDEAPKWWRVKLANPAGTVGEYIEALAPTKERAEEIGRSYIPADTAHADWVATAAPR